MITNTASVLMHGGLQLLLLLLQCVHAFLEGLLQLFNPHLLLLDLCLRLVKLAVQ